MLTRQENESVYDYEDRMVRLFYGADACLNRTMTGAPWAMPCCKKAGHSGHCEFIQPPDWLWTIIRVNGDTMSNINATQSMIYIIKNGDEFTQVYTIEQLFEKLQEWHNDHGRLPHNIIVYKCECLFDGG